MAAALRRALDPVLAGCPEPQEHGPSADRPVLTPPGHPRGPECATLRALVCTGEAAAARFGCPDARPDAVAELNRACSKLKDALRDARSPSLSQLAEIAQLLWDANRVCEILRIDRFADLQPLPAHRYLAYLAREGLVTEIVTTNYDCCIELAYRWSFGPELKGLPDDLDGDTLAVIRNLEEYRAKANTFYPKSVGIRQPILRLYKINGCAKAYGHAKQTSERHPGAASDALLAEEAERIILTERQLQSFRDENWAHDLFRDRARTRNLLFIGFGSEEPQVRHAALAITGEFDRQHRRVTAEQVGRLPNAPWVAAYEQLSFHQVQILAGYVQAHTGKDGAGPPLASRIAPLLENVFLGTDALDLDSPQPKLEADRFLRALFERTFAELLATELADDGIFANWLRAQAPDTWRQWRACLLPLAQRPDRAGSAAVPSRGATTPAPACLALLAPSQSEPHAPLRLWGWLWAMRFPSRAHAPDLWYLPLSEDPLLMLVTLLLVCALRPGSQTDGTDRGQNCAETLPDDWDFVRPVPGIGMAIGVSSSTAGIARTIYLVEERAVAQASTPAPHIAPGSGYAATAPRRSIRCVAVPSARYGTDRFRIEAPPGAGAVRRLFVGSRECLSAAEVVRCARAPGALADTLDELFAAQRSEPMAKARLKRLPDRTTQREEDAQ